jgi:hypothetical protein
MRVLCVADILAAIDDFDQAGLVVADGVSAMDDFGDFERLEEVCSTGIDG